MTGVSALDVQERVFACFLETSVYVDPVLIMFGPLCTTLWLVNDGTPSFSHTALPLLELASRFVRSRQFQEIQMT